MLDAAKTFAKALLKRSPIALTQNHRYDRQTALILRRALNSNSNCVDVGCHKGEILELMIKHAPQGTHRGFEPIPVLAQKLATRFQSNPQIIIRQVALSNQEGASDFNYVTSNPSYSGLIKRDYDRTGEEDTSIRVKTVRLDDEVPLGTRIDLLKIDVEGGELLVLEGAQRLLAEQRPLVIFEHGLGASEHYGSTPAKIYELLSHAGLRVSTLSGFLSDGPALTVHQLRLLFEQRKEYYFIAHR